MPDVRCTSASGHPATLLDGAQRPWKHGDVRTLPGMTASTLVARHPSRFAVVDRVVRESSPTVDIPAAVRDLHHKRLVAGIKSGEHDQYLGPLRERESAGKARSSVLEAIDARAREVAKGGA